MVLRRTGAASSAARTSFLAIAGLLVVAALAAAAFVWSGLYGVGADDPHTRPVHALLQSVRDRSIDARAGKLAVPDLTDEARIVQGAGNYDAMCTGCHLKPGLSATELSRGLYPAPPDLTRQHVDAARAFWVVKHGIKASGMPAWGHSMEDAYIWNMVAFLQRLPDLDATGYQALVDRSGGHSHGGGETDGHAGKGEDHPHGDGMQDHHADDPVPASPTTHVHADGKRHEHTAPAPEKAQAAAGPTRPAEAGGDTPPRAGDDADAGDAEPTGEHDAHEHQH